jgi:hypothetical protein
MSKSNLGSALYALSGWMNVWTKAPSTPASSKMASVSVSSRACSASSRTYFLSRRGGSVVRSMMS